MPIFLILFERVWVNQNEFTWKVYSYKVTYILFESILINYYKSKMNEGGCQRNIIIILYFTRLLHEIISIHHRPRDWFFFLIHLSNLWSDVIGVRRGLGNYPLRDRHVLNSYRLISMSDVVRWWSTIDDRQSTIDNLSGGGGGQHRSVPSTPLVEGSRRFTPLDLDQAFKDICVGHPSSVPGLSRSV